VNRLVLALVGATCLFGQVRVAVQDGKVIYTRPETDPAFNANGIGWPPKGMDATLWYAYDHLIRTQAELRGVDPVLVKAVIYCESRFHWRATSKAKAKGLMQVMDGTASRMGGTTNVRQLGNWDPIENITLGVEYLSRLQGRYRGNLIKIAAAYNAGEGAVDRHGGVPPFKETQGYVPAVLQMWSRINSGR